MDLRLEHAEVIAVLVNISRVGRILKRYAAIRFAHHVSHNVDDVASLGLTWGSAATHRERPGRKDSTPPTHRKEKTLAGQRALRHEQILGLDDAHVARDHVARGQLNYIADHAMSDRDLLRRTAAASRGRHRATRKPKGSSAPKTWMGAQVHRIALIGFSSGCNGLPI